MLLSPFVSLLFEVGAVAAASDTPQSVLNSTSIIVAGITALGTFLVAFLTFRGKTQDTANWLIQELRTEAKSARAAAVDCEKHREEDRRIIEDLRGNIIALETGVARLAREKNDLRAEIEDLKERIPPCS